MEASSVTAPNVDLHLLASYILLFSSGKVSIRKLIAFCAGYFNDHKNIHDYRSTLGCSPSIPSREGASPKTQWACIDGYNRMISCIML